MQNIDHLNEEELQELIERCEKRLWELRGAKEGAIDPNTPILALSKEGILSNLAVNRLEGYAETLSDLRYYSKEELLKIRYLGKKIWAEIQAVLERASVKFRADNTPPKFDLDCPIKLLFLSGTLTRYEEDQLFCRILELKTNKVSRFRDLSEDLFRSLEEWYPKLIPVKIFRLICEEAGVKFAESE